MSSENRVETGGKYVSVPGALTNRHQLLLSNATNCLVALATDDGVSLDEVADSLLLVKNKLDELLKDTNKQKINGNTFYEVL